MTSHIRLLAAMRQVLQDADISEVAAAGEFRLPAVKPVLFPGAVYGFAARLTAIERKALFDEATARGWSRLRQIDAFKPIEKDLYPIYWGKDKQLGARPHQHLQDPKKTGAIRLSTYKSLKGKTIACVSITVSDYVGAERALQGLFPDLLKTSKKKYAT
jgi:hypothetical protein